MTWKPLRQILNFATGGLKPDLTVLLDVDLETGLNRRKQSGGEWNRLDAYALALHQRVRDGYQEMVRAEPEPLESDRRQPAHLTWYNQPCKKLYKLICQGKNLE